MGVYRHLSFYPSDSQSVTGDGKVTVRVFLRKRKADVADNEDERFYLPSPFWYEGQNVCRNGKKLYGTIDKGKKRKQIGANRHKFRPQMKMRKKRIRKNRQEFRSTISKKKLRGC